MGSFDISCDRIRPTIKMDPQMTQETELLTFSPIIGRPLHSPLLKKNHGYTKHSQLRRRSPTFLTLKYGFVIFVIAASIATLCDIDKLKSETSDLEEPLATNLSAVINSSVSNDSSFREDNISPSNVTTTSPQSPTLPVSSNPISIGNMSITPSYRRWSYHKMKIPLYVYMAVSVAVLFMAIFGRTLENILVPFSFGLFMLLEIGIMIGLCIKETELGLGYSWYLWAIYIFHVIFSLSFSSIILVMQHLS